MCNVLHVSCVMHQLSMLHALNPENQHCSQGGFASAYDSDHRAQVKEGGGRDGQGSSTA